MTKKEFEKRIMVQTKELYHEYKKINPSGNYLSLSVVEQRGHVGYSVIDDPDTGIIDMYDLEDIK